MDEIVQDVYIAENAAHHAMNSRSSEIMNEIDKKMEKCNEIMDAINT